MGGHDGSHGRWPAHDIVAEVDGELAAVGACEHWVGTPDSLEMTWGAARRFLLTVQVAGRDVAASLDALLSLWRDHLAGHPGVRDADSAAVVTWPSRDVDGITTLLNRGFAPRGVLAGRVLDRQVAADSDGRRDRTDCCDRTHRAHVHVRAAVPADIAALVSLGQEVIRFDSHFGGVIERPGTASAILGPAGYRPIWTSWEARPAAAIR